MPGNESAPGQFAPIKAACNSEVSADISYPRSSYAWFVVIVLTLAYGLALIDRQVMSLMVAPIRADLHITDTEFSLTIGVAFAIFYTTLGVFFGRRADTSNRRNMIVGGMMVWSLATAACGLAGNFQELFAARLLVGVGEAVLGPAAYSMIADYFPKDRRARAVSVYTMGVYMGSGVALVFGGALVAATAHSADVVLPLLGHVRNWQAVFLIVGLLGPLMAALMLLVKEPRRLEISSVKTTLSDVFNFVRTRAKPLLLILGAFSMNSLTNISLVAWTPALLTREFGWTAGKIGAVLGLSLLIAGSAGVLAGGWWVSRPSISETRQVVLMTARNAILGVIPFLLVFCLFPDPPICIAALVCVAFAVGLAQALCPVALYDISPNEFRGQVIAFWLLAGNLFGWAVGVPLVGMGDDYLFHNDLAVGKSLALVLVLASLVGGACLQLVMRLRRAP